MEVEIDWFEVVIDKPEETPLWMRLVGVNEDGVIYLPSSMSFENELSVALSASDDSVSFILHRNHAYYPADWIAENYPRSKELATKMEKYIKDRL